MRIAEIVAAAAISLWLAAPAALAAGTIDVAKTAGCGCCIAWIRHMEEAGYTVTTQDLPVGSLAKLKRESGVAPELSSCHTAFIEGYVIEGHVPAHEIARLLSERPSAVGLAVPGMPLGSPGMESGDAEAYQVLLIRPDGTTEIYARYD